MTPIGAASNVFIVSLADSVGKPLTFKKWLRNGSTIAFATCAVGSAALLLAIQLGLL